MKPTLLFIYCGLSLSLSACQNHKKTKPPASALSNTLPSAIACKEPRRQFCTREFKPVCAIYKTTESCDSSPCAPNKQDTRSNACTACSDHAISHYHLGACEK